METTGQGKTYRINVVRIQMVRDSSLQTQAKVVRTAPDAAQILRAYLAGEDREHFVVLCLDTRNKVTAINTVSTGTLSSAPVHPREVFKAAVLANAAAVILGHNHPSGDPTPSQDDILITQQLRAAGSILGIEVLDHIIVGDDGKYVSLREARQGF